MSAGSARGSPATPRARATPTRGALTRLVERAQCLEQRADRPGVADPLDDPFRREPAVPECSDQGADRLVVAGERQAGAGREPHIRVVVVEHPLEGSDPTTGAQMGEDQHGPAARGRAAASLAGAEAGG